MQYRDDSKRRLVGKKTSPKIVDMVPAGSLHHSGRLIEGTLARDDRVEKSNVCDKLSDSHWHSLDQRGV